MSDEAAPASGGSSCRVMIIDDSRATRLVIRTFMREFGFETEESQDGAEALKFLSDNRKVDLIICDWEMPRMNGVEFVRQYRGSHCPGAQEIPIVMSTTINTPECIAEALEAGATDYIMKPFTKEIFAAKLDLLGIQHK